MDFCLIIKSASRNIFFLTCDIDFYFVNNILSWLLKIALWMECIFKMIIPLDLSIFTPKIPADREMSW
jgi:hypothetical protein